MKTLKIQLPEEVIDFVYRHRFVAASSRNTMIECKMNYLIRSTDINRRTNNE